ncbi:MAG: hypothetical protein S4CHLAM6_09230 [Chlamydiae bacterium]|nr:hypothetical protein [Chlamydiota bacterium]
MHKAVFWLILTLSCLLVQAFFAMMEMASVSFNKVRLQYFVSKGSKRAQWLYSLLQNPPRLFGTTLFGVNFCMQVGSECSRRLYFALGLNPDLAPLSQVIVVLIFAELTPLFAARKFSGHVIMSGIPIIYIFSKIMIPITWTIGLISKSINFLFTGKGETHLMNITRDELQRAVEEQSHEIRPIEEDPEFNQLVNNILNLKKKQASNVMTPLHKVHMASSAQPVGKVREALDQTYHPFLPIYQKQRHNIIGIVDTRSIIRAHSEDPIKKFISQPWFVVQDNSASEILNQFRHNQQKSAIVLDHQGQAIGVLTLNDLVKALFGEGIEDPLPIIQPKQFALVDRTLSAEMPLKVFNEEFHADIGLEGCHNLGDLVEETLGHLPEKGELVKVGSYEMRIEEVSLGNVKKVWVRSTI